MCSDNVEFSVLSKIDVLTHTRMTPYQGVDEKVVCHLIDDDNERMEELMKCIKEDDSEVVFAYFNTLARAANNEEEEKTAAVLYNDILAKVVEAIPPATVLFVYTGGGSLTRVSALQDPNAKKAEAQLCRQGMLWVKITPPED